MPLSTRLRGSRPMPGVMTSSSPPRLYLTLALDRARRSKPGRRSGTAPRSSGSWRRWGGRNLYSTPSVRSGPDVSRRDADRRCGADLEAWELAQTMLDAAWRRTQTALARLGSCKRCSDGVDVHGLGPRRLTWNRRVPVMVSISSLEEPDARHLSV